MRAFPCANARLVGAFLHQKAGDYILPQHSWRCRRGCVQGSIENKQLRTAGLYSVDGYASLVLVPEKKKTSCVRGVLFAVPKLDSSGAASGGVLSPLGRDTKPHFLTSSSSENVGGEAS